MKHKRIAVIAVTKIKKKDHICLVTGRTSKNWTIPTGKYEKKLSKRQVAALEAFEEAGVTGKFDPAFRARISAHSPNGKNKRDIIVYKLYVKKIFKRWPEQDQRKRLWTTPKKLAQHLKDNKFAELIRKWV